MLRLSQNKQKKNIHTRSAAKITSSQLLSSPLQQHLIIKNQGKSFNQANSFAQYETDEARFNLATRVMSNGVEVIVAGDKSTLPGDPNILRILPSSIYKPYTLAASTLKNNVLMMLPSEPEVRSLTFMIRNTKTKRSIFFS